MAELLHGRHLLPLHADRWHLVAPDHLGSVTPTRRRSPASPHTFDALTELTRDLLGQLGIERYAMYVHDYGAPIGWRLALHDLAAVTARGPSGRHQCRQGAVHRGVELFRRQRQPGLDVPTPLVGEDLG